MSAKIVTSLLHEPACYSQCVVSQTDGSVVVCFYGTVTLQALLKALESRWQVWLLNVLAKY